MIVGLHMPPYISAHVPPTPGSCERYLTASAYQQLNSTAKYRGATQ